MSYREHNVMSLIVVDPGRAETIIATAYRKSQACRRDTARALGCSEVTLWRWVRRLGLGARLKHIEEEALKGGWHHGRNGGRPKVTS